MILTLAVVVVVVVAVVVHCVRKLNICYILHDNVAKFKPNYEKLRQNNFGCNLDNIVKFSGKNYFFLNYRVNLLCFSD